MVTLNGKEEKAPGTIVYILTCTLTPKGVECSEYAKHFGGSPISPYCEAVLKEPPSCEFSSLMQWRMCRAQQLMEKEPEKVRAHIPFTKSKSFFGAAMSLAMQEALEKCRARR